SYLRPITYQGGREAIQEIINQHLVYPELAREHAIEGSVMLQFSIDTSGKVSYIQVTEKVGFGCDKEALRIAQFLTSWIPAQTGPNLVPSTIYLPIQFGLR
ncbi:MAG: energy transducer TonB, partial [Saprospiraceae bacterium]|nr:energy transducer TonB [Saprospiraceae bacterium]